MIDRALLDLLQEGRVTPFYCRLRLEQEYDREYTRGYVQQRLNRLAEHGHAENLLDVGLYQLVEDPRE